MAQTRRKTRPTLRRAIAAMSVTILATFMIPISALAHHKPYTVTINDVAVNEGDAGTTPLTFTVTVTPVPAETLSLSYTTANGTALAGSDYTSTSGTLVFSPGQGSKSVSALARGDLEFEQNEIFYVDISGPGKRMHIAKNRGVGTILNEDPPPSFSVSDIAVTEGDSGEANAVFDVTLDAPASTMATVDYATTGVSATEGDSAGPGVDFRGTSGTLTFAAGDQSEPVAVGIFGDKTDEDDETYRVELSGNSAGTAIDDGTGVGTIADNDPEPTVSVTDAVANEPINPSSPNSAVFTVSLSSVSEKTVRVEYSTAEQNPPDAIEGTDYEAASGTLVFDPGEQSKDVFVPIIYDGIDPANPENPEGFERFRLNLNAIAEGNASVGDGLGVGTITEETVPKLYVSDASLNEGNAGQTTARISLTLSAPTPGMVNGTFSTADGTAAAGSDYAAVSGGAFSFDGSSSRTTTIEVAVNGDTLDEDHEVFNVVVSSPDVQLGDDTGTVTILDADVPPIASIGDIRVVEGNGGPTNVSFTVALSVPSGRSINVGYTTADGTAESPADYEADTGQFDLAAGETSKAVSIRVEGDTDDEPSFETFFVDITPEAGKATVGKARGTATIVDDDKTPTTTTLRVKRSQRIVAKGLVSPPVPGRKVVVKLFRKSGGRWVRVATHRPALSAAGDFNGDNTTESRYLTKFSKPRRGTRCKVSSRFPGNADYFRSTAINKFRCRR
jgi:hypothetical protein